MSARVARWAARGLRKARSRLIQGSAILCYHRVAPDGGNPLRHTVTPERFAEQLEVVRRIATPTALDDLVRAVRDGNVRRGTVAVTFDDGYADNLHAAKPTLARLDIPATVYVVAGWLGRHFWWDELAAHIPDRRRLLRAHRRILRASHDERQSMIEEIPATLGKSGSRSIARILTADEVAELARDGLVSIGAHSVTHPVLTALPSNDQRREICRSKERLETVLGRSVDTFAYPWGATNEVTRRLVSEAGFLSASGGHVDVVSGSSDPYDLPRLWVRNVDADRFARWLRSWLGG